MIGVVRDRVERAGGLGAWHPREPAEASPRPISDRAAPTLLGAARLRLSSLRCGVRPSRRVREF